MHELDIAFTFIDAIDGERLTASQLSSYSEWRSTLVTGRGLTLGEVGCALSHLASYERMVRENIPELLILEDDSAPKPELIEMLASTRLLPADRDVVTLHSTFSSARPVPISDSPLVGESFVCRYERHSFGTVGYLVTLRAAKRLLRVGLPVRRPADDLLFRDRPARLVVYGIEPNIVGHRVEFPSEVRDLARTPQLSPLQRAAATTARLARRAASPVRQRLST
jgi:glycosyl transferase family 25